MTLVFENELYEMTERAREAVLDDEWHWLYGDADVLFEEVPYSGFRTDLVAVWFDVDKLSRRYENVGNLTALPDERKYRHSYRNLQRLEPISRKRWVHEDSTYSSEQTCREVWDWLAENGYLRPLRPEETGEYQESLPGLETRQPTTGSDPCVVVKFPDVARVTAIELKQRDWETALRQAIRADSYADLRYVIMDAGGVDDALEHRRTFCDAGVGLGALDDDGLEMHIRADGVSPPRTQTRQLVTERALAELPDGTRQEAIEHAE